MLPRLEPGDCHATRPLISLIVPVWNDDELVVDLVSRLGNRSDSSLLLSRYLLIGITPSADFQAATYPAELFRGLRPS